jgi:glycerophosphoryl diester phosphodiesterase
MSLRKLGSAAYLALLLWAPAAQAGPNGPDVHVQAHRGASADRIENTLAAFQRAIEIGATSVELDVHVTRDGHLVVYHDFALDPKTTRRSDGTPLPGPIPINSLTLLELQAMQVHDTHRLTGPDVSTPADRRIPTLAEVFALFRNSPHPNAKKMIIDIEIKSDPAQPKLSPAPAEFARKVVDSIQANWERDRTVVRSFDHRTLTEVRKLEPRLVLAALTDEGFTGYERLARELKPNIISPHRTSFTRADVEHLHSRGIQVIPWTVNRAEDWDRLLGWGVDGLTTDDPQRLIDHMGTRGRRRLIPSFPLCRFDLLLDLKVK